MASSSSCPPRNAKKLHDVFLSFRGEDTRDNFTSHLHYVLSLKGIKTFVDDQLIRGDNISRSLLDTIEASSISIIIFSERPESKLIEAIANGVLKRLDATFQSENKGLVGVAWRIKEIESLLCIRSAGVYVLGIWGIGGIGKTTIAGAVFNKISRCFEGSYFALDVREAEETGRIKDLQKELLSKLLNDGNARNVESQLNRLARKKVLLVFDDVNHPGQIESLIGCLDELASGSRVIITTRDKQVLENCWVNQIYRMKELVDVDAHKLFCQCAFRGGHLDASYTEVTRKAIKYAHGVPLALQVLGRHLCGRSKEVWESAMRKLEIIPHVDILKVLKISYDSLDDSQKNVFLDIACLLEGEHRDEVTSFFDASGFQAKIELSVLEDKSLITCLNNQIRMHDLLRDMGREIVRNESIDLPGKRSRLWYHKDIDEVLKKNTGTEAIKGISLDMNKVNRKIHMDSFAFSKMPKLRFLKFYGFENKCMVSHLDGVLFAELRHLEWQQYPLKTLNIHAENLVSLQMPFSKVEQLWDDVQLGEVGIKELPSSIECLSNLGELLITDCSELESISSSVFKLKSLNYIEISNCSNLKRFLEIPSCNTDGSTGIERLGSSLKTLTVDGTAIREVPKSLDGSTGIERLGSCELVLKECSNIECLPSSMCMFKSLTSLEIVDCQNFKRLPDELGNFEALSTLTIDGTVIREVPESLGRLPLLYSLQLKKCSELEYISSSIFRLKSDIEISNCSNLKRFLEIPSCNTDGSTGIEWLGSYELVLKECSNIESLPSSLCMFKSLTSLEIVDCQNFKRLPDELGNLEALRMLTVDGTTIREVPESLGQLPLLYSLQLKNCSELEYISSSIFKMKSLESIEISNCSNLKSFLENPSCNTDGGTRIEKLASSRLKLEGCSSLESLPSSLCMFKNLTSLEIIDCQNFKRLPNELGNSKCLTVLIVKGTAIREVPESLEYLRSLPSKLTSHNLSVDLRNCLKLDPNELSEIVKDQWMKQSLDVNFGTTKSMYFPGNEIPKWFSLGVL
ncbi:ADP-ribosyl cyclase/cyclic ADP-ribose hydrolase [Citrus sinensis]|nr:ADP-ribosyl cyclase/cyclic ADP-ribose hydrolase [Citrus sinensis]